MPDPAALQLYLDRHFLPLAAFAAAGEASPGEVQDLIAAGALPAPSYTTWRDGFSSPIGGPHGAPQSGPVRHWFAPAAVWWLRRARLLPGSAKEVAASLETRFAAAFLAALETHPDAALAYPDAVVDGVVQDGPARALAASEWRDWIDGGYGVCLRRFDAESLIVKAAERARIVALTDTARDAATQLALVDALERLEAVMLPFAPHQRPHGTPGLWIDAVLFRHGLGHVPLLIAEPAANPAATDRLCA